LPAPKKGVGLQSLRNFMDAKVSTEGEKLKDPTKGLVITNGLEKMFFREGDYNHKRRTLFTLSFKTKGEFG